LIDLFDLNMRRALLGRPEKGVIPVGLRGVGKTVLLNRFAQMAQREGYEVGFVEAPEGGGFAALLAAKIRRILLALQRGSLSRSVNRALAVLKSFTLTLPDGISIRVDPDPLVGEADSGILSEDITDLLVATGEAAASRGGGVLIAVDEIQYLESHELSATIVAIHRTTQLNLPVMIAGAGLPQLPGLAGEAKSYAERLFEFPEIGPLPLAEARAALEIPADASGVEIEPNALDMLVEASAAYPYFIQEWGKHAWNLADGPAITAGDVEASGPLVEAALDQNFFRVRLDRLTPSEKQYLRAMAQLGPGPHRSGDIAAQLGTRVEGVAPRRAMLIKKGMVYSPAHGDTAFTVPLFDRFMLRVMP
jgi:hypothetical protein